MSKEKKEGVDIIIEAMNQYLSHVVETTQFNLQELIEFMEPKFVEAGYRSQNNFGEKNNVLILHDAGAGDFVLESAAIREIRRIYPDANITLVTTPPTADLAECCPYVDELVVNGRKFDEENILSAIQWNFELATNFLKKRFDVCYAFARNFDTPILMYMSGAKNRVTSYIYKDVEDEIFWVGKKIIPLALTINLATQIAPRYENSHRVDLNLSLVDSVLHAPVSNRAPEIWHIVYDFSVAKFLLQGAKDSVYALSMSGDYPAEKYAKIVEGISKKETKATFVILGAGDDALKAVENFKEVAPKIYEKKIIDLTNKINYRQSAAVLSLCDMYIGNSGDMMQIAAAAKCPVLAHCDFPEEKNYYPYGVPSVIVQPEKGLMEIHIEPKIFLKGFKQLKEQIAKKINEPIYIS